MNYYEILGLKTDCTIEEVKMAFQQIKNNYQPDLHQDKSYIESFKQSFEANYFLSDIERKKKYDYFLTKYLLNSVAASYWRKKELEKLKEETPEKTHWGEAVFIIGEILSSIV